MRALVTLFAVGFAAGVLLVVTGLRTRRTPREADGAGHPMLARTGTTTTKVVLAAAGGLAVAVLTGWPVAGLLAAVAVLTLPRALGRDRGHEQRLARMEAVASWAEDLAGTMRAARGLDQAVMQTAQTAPTALAPQLAALADQLRRGRPLEQALRAFGDDLADPTVDLVTAMLLYAATRPARDLAASLDAVAATARRQAAARMRIAAARARSRSAARIVTVVIVTVVAGIQLVAGDFLVGYATVAGQLRLALLGGGGGLCLWWMHRLAVIDDMPRILTASRHELVQASPQWQNPTWAGRS
ncbi:type II secretion system F family protein [Catellatospora sp. KI3]|uniref:type II secretion system F family protein n=1 Tax=Catellatospora sp. KI3 TaxID=3041620 RepID=UPI0024826F72|nr:type II secretion system F family protein [Catellatospora sp. KI3]MDI1461031.1 type II secretion system F family protein [Catellatospora sp. KI3]